MWLYGSRARGEATGPGSDIDVMVITTGGRMPDFERVHDAAMEAEPLMAGEETILAHFVADPAWIAGRGEIEGGVWSLFFRLFVDSGRFERGLYAEARQIERVRLDAHYEAREVPLEMAGQVTAVRFVAAVERMLSE